MLSDADSKKIVAMKSAFIHLAQEGGTKGTPKEAGIRYYGALVQQIPIAIEDLTEQKTLASTDGQSITLDRRWFDSLKINLAGAKEYCGQLSHELLHIVLEHTSRSKKFGADEKERMNLAMDLSVNPMILECGLSLPAGVPAAVPGQGEFKDLPVGESFEFYYSALKNMKPPQGGKDKKKQQGGGGDYPQDVKAPGQPQKGEGDGDKQDGDGQPNNGDSDFNDLIDKDAARISAMKEQAKVMAKQVGNMPAMMQKTLATEAESKVDWRAILWSFVSKITKDDVSWKRINRRYVHQGIYAPGKYSEEIQEICYVWDTSGSMWGELGEQVRNELSAIADSFPSRYRVIYHDTHVAGEQVFEAGEYDPKEIVMQGGGGTSHVPVLKHVENLENTPDLVICVTDMASQFPPAYNGDAPLIWVVVGAGKNYTKPPYGEFIEVS